MRIARVTVVEGNAHVEIEGLDVPVIEVGCRGDQQQTRAMMPNFQRVLLLKDESFRQHVEELYGKEYLEAALKKAEEEQALLETQP